MFSHEFALNNLITREKEKSKTKNYTEKIVVGQLASGMTSINILWSVRLLGNCRLLAISQTRLSNGSAEGYICNTCKF